MFVWTGIFLIIALISSLFAFRKKPTLAKKITKWTFWISLLLFVILTVTCIVHVRNLIAEGKREKWVIDSMENSAK